MKRTVMTLAMILMLNTYSFANDIFFTREVDNNKIKQQNISVILDDCGASDHDIENLGKLVESNIADNIVFAVMPDDVLYPKSKKFIALCAKYDLKVMLHQPGEYLGEKEEPKEYSFKIMNGDSDATVKQKLSQNIDGILSELKKYNKENLFIGMNLHQSSSVSQNERIMEVYGDVLKNYEKKLGRDLIFVDSLTSKYSVAHECIDDDVLSYKRTVFLDHYEKAAENKKIVGTYLNSSRKQMVLIGHIKKNSTIELLKEIVPSSLDKNLTLP